MKNTTHWLAAIAALNVITLGSLHGAAPEENAPAANKEESTAPAEAKRSTPSRIKYTMPSASLGGAAVRQSGGTRGGGENQPALYVLAPDHIALTTQAQPSLFWYQTAPSKSAFQLTLTEPRKSKPVLSISLPHADRAGIRALSLGKQGVTLQPGIPYQWNVVIITDPSNRSKDIVASGVIKRVEPSPELDEKIASASLTDRAVHYASAGIWYDALQSISAAIAKDPKDGELHKLRVSLLKQAGLQEAAAADSR